MGAASVLFYIPVLREFLLLCGARDASRPNIIEFLRRGLSVALNTGGNWEMTVCEHDREKLFVQAGLGFVKLSLQTGTPILPMCEQPPSTPAATPTLPCAHKRDPSALRPLSLLDAMLPG